MGFVLNRRARLFAQLAKVQALLASLYASMTTASGTDIESYSFDSGEGSQRVTRRKLQSILDEIERLEATEEHLINEIYGVGVVAIQQRRKSPC